MPVTSKSSSGIIKSAIKSAILKLAQKLGLFKVLGALNSAAQMLSSYQAMFNAFNIKLCK